MRRSVSRPRRVSDADRLRAARADRRRVGAGGSCSWRRWAILAGVCVRVPARAPERVVRPDQAAFAHFGGRPQTLLVDNAKALVDARWKIAPKFGLTAAEAFCHGVGTSAPGRARRSGPHQQTENGVAT